MRKNFTFKTSVMLNLFQHLMFMRFRNSYCIQGHKARFAAPVPFVKFGMTFRHGFTLAEVLITLTIIGVIAALTIPNLMRKWEDHNQLAAIKSAYAILDNAYRMALAENGPRSEWAWPHPNEQLNGENADYFLKELAKHLKVQKYCGTKKGCFQYMKFGSIENVSGRGYISSGNFDAYSYCAKMVLHNGMRIVASFSTPLSGTATDNYIGVDTNGAKGPNKYGYDFFKIRIGEKSLEPAGGYGGTWAKNCNPTVERAEYPDSCIYWIFRHNNMDYKYRDVSAEW